MIFDRDYFGNCCRAAAVGSYLSSPTMHYSVYGVTPQLFQSQNCNLRLLRLLAAVQAVVLHPKHTQAVAGHNMRQERYWGHRKEISPRSPQIIIH